MVKAFILSDFEMFQHKTFMLQHEESCNAPTSISFTFTDAGHLIHVECMGCGEILDITDTTKLLEGR